MTAPAVHTARGQVWIRRDDQAIYLTPDEIPAVVAALLVEQDRLEDARD